MEGKDNTRQSCPDQQDRKSSMTDLDMRQAEALGKIIDGMERDNMPYDDPVRWAILGSLLDDTGNINDLKNKKKKK